MSQADAEKEFMQLHEHIQRRELRETPETYRYVRSMIVKYREHLPTVIRVADGEDLFSDRALFRDDWNTLVKKIAIVATKIYKIHGKKNPDERLQNKLRIIQEMVDTIIAHRDWGGLTPIPLFSELQSKMVLYGVGFPAEYQVRFDVILKKIGETIRYNRSKIEFAKVIDDLQALLEEGRNTL